VGGSVHKPGFDQAIDDAAKCDRFDFEEVGQAGLTDTFIARQIGKYLPIETASDLARGHDARTSSASSEPRHAAGSR